MKPCARLSGLCGLAALVASVVAISFLATHASAQNLCTSDKDCGDVAFCKKYWWGRKCTCDTGYFIAANKSCGDPCAGIECGPRSSCKVEPDDGSARCWCDFGTAFNETDKTCHDLCADKDCDDGTCVINPDFERAECVCKKGFVFDEDNTKCVVDPCVSQGVDCGLDAHCVGYSSSDFGCECNKEGFLLSEDMTCYAPVVRTSIIDLSGSYQKGDYGRDDTNFFLEQSSEQSIGTTVCRGMEITDGDRITVVWNATTWHTYVYAAGYNRDENYAPANAMCKRLLFHNGDNCTGNLGFTIARPAKKGSSYPITKRTMKGIAEVRSVGCEITMCENDCGSAKCVVKEGKPRCQCPEGLVFNAAKKLCLDPSLAPRRAGGQVKKWWP
ncbi:unnamed protein product [Closterium sp. NIES-53]